MAGALCLLAGRAFALDGVSLDWHAPPICPQQDAVEAEIGRLLGTQPPSSTHLSAMAEVTEDTRFQLSLVVNNAPARIMYSDNCAELASATSLILAIAIDPSVATRALDPEPAAPTPPPPPPNPRPAPRAVEVAHRDEEPVAALHWGAEIFADYVVGTVPRSEPWFGIAALARLDRFDFTVGARLAPSRQASLAHDSTIGADFSAWNAFVQVAYAILDRAVRLSAYAGAEFGRISATGFGVDVPYTGHSFWSALSAGAQIHLQVVQSVHVHGQLGVVVPLRRNDFALGDGRVVDRAEALGAIARIGVAFIF